MTDNFKQKTDHALASLHLSETEKYQLAAFAVEKSRIKKKLPAVLILAIVLILALGGITVAGGMNVFAMFTDYDARLERLIYSSVIEDPVTVQVETDYIGTSAIAVTNAHFDDDHLILGFTVENMVAAESFVPTEEELASMRPWGLDTACGIFWTNEEQQELENWYQRAVRARLPYSRGIKSSQIAVTFVIPGENGQVHTMDYRWDHQPQPDGLVCHLYRMQGLKTDPFIEQLMKQSSITLEMRIYESTYRLWYDGEEQYARWTNEWITSVPITLEKSYKSLNP